jgi:hypothetical protein
VGGCPKIYIGLSWPVSLFEFVQHGGLVVLLSVEASSNVLIPAACFF